MRFLGQSFLDIFELPGLDQLLAQIVHLELVRSSEPLPDDLLLDESGGQIAAQIQTHHAFLVGVLDAGDGGVVLATVYDDAVGTALGQAVGDCAFEEVDRVCVELVE